MDRTPKHRVGAPKPWRATATLSIAVLLAPAPAQATYSIIAVDLLTGQVGGAGTSCVGSQVSVSEIYGAVPGMGVVVAQAALNFEGRDRAVALLAQGDDPAAIIADITSPGFDLLAMLRQYAVIDASGAATGFTGVGTMAYADDVQGSAGTFVYSVQGNILTGAAVLDQAASVFQAPGCDLADTLMLALEAGARDGAGDSRCTPDGIPSDGAFIQVNLPDQAGGTAYLHLQVDDTRPDDPLVRLRERFDAWRGDHPCAGSRPDPSERDAGPGDAAVDASPPPASAPIEPPPNHAGGSPAPGSNEAGSEAAPAGAAGAGAGTDRDTPPAIADGAEPRNAGCALSSPVQSTSSGRAALAITLTALLAIAALTRRR